MGWVEGRKHTVQRTKAGSKLRDDQHGFGDSSGRGAGVLSVLRPSKMRLQNAPRSYMRVQQFQRPARNPEGRVDACTHRCLARFAGALELIFQALNSNLSIASNTLCLPSTELKFEYRVEHPVSVHHIASYRVCPPDCSRTTKTSCVHTGTKQRHGSSSAASTADVGTWGARVALKGRRVTKGAT